MNKQNTPQPISRAKLFSLLAARAEDSDTPEDKQGAIRSLNIPKDLSEVLDALLYLSEDTLKRQPEGTLSEILRLGIHAWYNQLNNESRLTLGLQEEPLQEDFEEDLDDPNPAMAQQQADAYAQAMGTVGYTPMTIHSLGANGNSKQSAQQRNKKRVQTNASPDRRRRNKSRGRRR